MRGLLGPGEFGPDSDRKITAGSGRASTKQVPLCAGVKVSTALLFSTAGLVDVSKDADHRDLSRNFQRVHRQTRLRFLAANAHLMRSSTGL